MLIPISQWTSFFSPKWKDIRIYLYRSTPSLLLNACATFNHSLQSLLRSKKVKSSMLSTTTQQSSAKSPSQKPLCRAKATRRFQKSTRTRPCLAPSTSKALVLRNARHSSISKHSSPLMVRSTRSAFVAPMTRFSSGVYLLSLVPKTLPKPFSH